MQHDDERLKSIVGASPIGVIILDNNGVQLWINQHACEMFGVTEDEVVGIRPTIYRPEPGALGELERLYKQHGRARNFEFHLRRVDTGEDIWVSSQIEPLVFGGVSARICWLTDITAYKLADRERETAQIRAETAEVQLRAIAEALPVGVIVFDADRKLTFWNEQYCALTATTSEAYRRMVTHRDVCAYVYDLFPNLQASTFDEFLALWETRMWGEDQGPVVLDFEEPRMTSLQFVSRLPDGGSVLVVVDITEQKDAEIKALRAQQDAEDANRAKSTFLAAMSHEIRTPMNGVLGMTEVLEQSVLSAEQRTMTSTVRESASALLTIIDDVLDFSKIEAGHLELETVPVALRPLLESTLDSIAGAAEEKSLDLSLIIDPEVPDAVIGDPVRLRQIALNLLSNAIKFTATGGVSLSVTANPVPGQVSITMITFSVTDSGIGISDDSQRTLFTPFTQAESSTTRRFGGTGLGLSICQRLAALMGGSLGVESKVAEGARFWFAVPLEVSAARSEPFELDLTGLSVLLVSQEERLSSMTAAILGAAGAKVSRRGSPPDFDTSPDGFDAIVMDDRSGATTTLKQPAIILTAAGRASNTSRDVDHRIINRPPRRDALVRAVAIVTGRVSRDTEAATEARDLSSMLDSVVPDIEVARDAGQLVLVAEDNATNRLVVERQLALLGHACEIAEDGGEALEMWRRGRHALLLTDCHMPNMDGYDLTRTIRHEEGPDVRLPIVALTANALAGEADRCFEVGMDDYLAKPVTLRELRRVLGRWLSADANVPNKVARGASNAEGIKEASPIDRDLLNEIFGDEDPELFEMVAKSFRDSALPLFEDLRLAIAERQVMPLRLAAHKAAGAAGSLAAVPLRDVLQRLEERAGEDDWAVLEKLGGEVEVLLQELISHLEYR
jgi:PAS domain S-box-containing protein